MATYHIVTDDNLQAMKDDLAGDYILDNDINMTGYAWEPVGTKASPFTGTLEGGNFTISNLNNITLPANGDYVGLFGTCNSATIENLTMTGFSIDEATLVTDCNYWGCLSGYFNGGTIDNVSVSGEIIVQDTVNKDLLYLGGLIGEVASEVTITNTWTNVDISITRATSSGGFIGNYGGFIGRTLTKSFYGEISDCYTTGSTTIDVHGGGNIGGLIGSLFMSETINESLTIHDCYTTGDIIGTSLDNDVFGVGGFIGWGRNNTASTNLLIIYDCYATGNISLETTADDIFSIGGFIGTITLDRVYSCYSTSNITLSYTGGSVKTISEVGGFAGDFSITNRWSGIEAYVKDCYTTGNIICSGTNVYPFDVGGFIGDATIFSLTDATLPVYMQNCFSTSDITFSNCNGCNLIGGVVGTLSCYYNAYVQKCYYHGTITIDTNGTGFTQLIGGLIGLCTLRFTLNTISLLKDCYTKGTINITVDNVNQILQDIGGSLGSVAVADDVMIANVYNAMDIYIVHDQGNFVRDIGGLIGQITHADNSRGVNLYNIGLVSIKDSVGADLGGTQNVGGFIGNNIGGAITNGFPIINCYYWTGAYGKAIGDDITLQEAHIGKEATKTNFLDKTHTVYNQIAITYYDQENNLLSFGSYEFGLGNTWGFGPDVVEPATTPRWYEHIPEGIYPDFKIIPAGEYDAGDAADVNASMACVNRHATVYGGLDHLEGETVSILADGVVLDQQVVTNGAVTFPTTYSHVFVGLPYNSDLETLDIEIGDAPATIQNRRTKVGNVTFRLEDSQGGYIGPDSDNLYEAFTQYNIIHSSGQNVGTLDMFTGDIRMPLGGEYSDGGRVFYRQVDPLPITIGAIIPEVAIGGPAS